MKNADGQAGREHRTAPSQEGHAAGPARSAPDEALIEVIAKQAFRKWYRDEIKKVSTAVKWAIREYIRRSAGKEKG